VNGDWGGDEVNWSRYLAVAL